MDLGPFRIPLLGSLPLLPKEVRDGKVRMSSYLKEKYGKVVGLYGGNKPNIFISDYDYVKELYKVKNYLLDRKFVYLKIISILVRCGI